jgi:hypothetical protein
MDHAITDIERDLLLALDLEEDRPSTGHRDVWLIVELERKIPGVLVAVDLAS